MQLTFLHTAFAILVILKDCEIYGNPIAQTRELQNIHDGNYPVAISRPIPDDEVVDPSIPHAGEAIPWNEAALYAHHNRNEAAWYAHQNRLHSASRHLRDHTHHQSSLLLRDSNRWPDNRNGAAIPPHQGAPSTSAVTTVPSHQNTQQ